MALSGSVTIDATPNSCDLLVFAWEAVQDTASGTSTVSWTMKLVADDTYGLITGVTEGTRTWTVVIDGQTFTGQNGVNIAAGKTRLLAEGTITLAHEADGSRSFDFTFSQEIGITWGASSGNPQEIGTVTGSGTGELDVIVVQEKPEDTKETFDILSFLNCYIMGICGNYRAFSKKTKNFSFEITTSARGCVGLFGGVANTDAGCIVVAASGQAGISGVFAGTVAGPMDTAADGIIMESAT